MKKDDILFNDNDTIFFRYKDKIEHIGVAGISSWKKVKIESALDEDPVYEQYSNIEKIKYIVECSIPKWLE